MDCNNCQRPRVVASGHFIDSKSLTVADREVMLDMIAHGLLQVSSFTLEPKLAVIAKACEPICLKGTSKVPLAAAWQELRLRKTARTVLCKLSMRFNGATATIIRCSMRDSS